MATSSLPLPTSSAPALHIVLVHGGLVDASSWAKVIPLLEAQGYPVTAVQNPLTSLADDVASTRRALALQDGPVLLVGHSWGGMVITEAGNDPKVTGLVYLAGFAPGPGQSLGDVAQQGPAAPGGQYFVADAAGFVRLTRLGMEENLTHDLTAAEGRLLFATQHPLAAATRGECVTAAAWQTRPSWYLIANDDRMVSPELQRTMARTINATTHALPGGHLPILAQPEPVAAFILAAAQQLSAR